MRVPEALGTRTMARPLRALPVRALSVLLVSVLILLAGPSHTPLPSMTQVSAEGQQQLGPVRIVELPVDADTYVRIMLDGENQEGPHDASFLMLHAHDLDPRDAVALLRFELPELREGSTLAGARLQTYVVSATLSPDQPVKPLWADMVTSGWEPGELSGVPAPLTRTGPSIDPGREEGWLEWDLSRTVERWLSGTPNHGLMLRLGHGLGDHLYYALSSSEGPHPPRLLLELEGPPEPIFIPWSSFGAALNGLGMLRASHR